MPIALPAEDACEPDRYRSELQDIYAALEVQVRDAGPVCALSGRCCRFAEYGHTLFISSPEFALLLTDATPPVRPLDDGASCPWQDQRGHCTAREARPLGCRVYYCDEGYQERSYELSEQFLTQLKKLARVHDLPWNYAPLHHHLRRAADQGRLPSLVAPGVNESWPAVIPISSANDPRPSSSEDSLPARSGEESRLGS